MKRPPAVSRLAAVRLVAMDVDGVLTDGGIWYTDHGDELKRFDVRDGQGLVLLRQAGVMTAVVTRRHSESRDIVISSWFTEAPPPVRTMRAWLGDENAQLARNRRPSLFELRLSFA